MSKEFGGPGLLLSDIVETFKKTLASLPRLFICIDELDGSPLEHPRELCESLQGIVPVSTNTRVFPTAIPISTMGF